MGKKLYSFHAGRFLLDIKMQDSRKESVKDFNQLKALEIACGCKKVGTRKGRLAKYSVLKFGSFWIWKIGNKKG